MTAKRILTKITTLIFAMAILIVTGPRVCADIIWTPVDDFFEENYGDCEYIDRYFVANTDGSVYEQPGSDVTLAQFKAGDVLYVSYVYTDSGSAQWGLVSHVGDAKRDTGWLRLADFTIKYDRVSFDGEHSTQYVPYANEFDGYQVKGSGIAFWEYPNSGELLDQLPKNDGDIIIDVTYTDEAGLLWGKVNYYRGLRGWVCISDPENTALGTQSSAQSDVTPNATQAQIKQTANTGALDTSKSDGKEAVIFIIAGVIALVALTAVLIKIFWSKPKQEL